MNKAEFRMKILYPCYVLAKKILRSPMHLPITDAGENANELIRKTLSGDSPAMICRFGGTEIRILLGYLNQKDSNLFHKIYHRLHLDPVGFSSKLRDMMKNGAGFFPPDDSSLSAFGELMLRDMKEPDVLACWRPEEMQMKKYLPENLRTVPLGDLEPFFMKTPWTSALRGKKVLVIHPFRDSIRKQYSRRERLFSNPDMLPDFDLQLYPAVQSIGGNSGEFKSWFDALEFMKNGISRLDFDIALIGAGAYGFPLAAHVKRMGKKAVHLGGVLQVLFGIIGNRWEMDCQYKRMFNEYWIRPSKTETPQGAEKVENSTYW